VSHFHSQGKRQRQANQARKKEAKAQERLANRGRTPTELPIVSAEELSGNLPSIEDAMRAIENSGSGERLAPAISVRLFVGNLSDGVGEAELRAAFGAFGPVADAVVVMDRDTGDSRGFGFVTMSSRRDVPKAIEALDGSELDGQAIVVNIATARTR
jgi:RNA recognition motif-containing protein